MTRSVKLVVKASTNSATPLVLRYPVWFSKVCPSYYFIEIILAFDEAFAAEDSFFKYLLTFRMFRYARVVLGVGKLPLDMFFILSKK